MGGALRLKEIGELVRYQSFDVMGLLLCSSCWQAEDVDLEQIVFRDGPSQKTAVAPIPEDRCVSCPECRPNRV